MGRIIAISVSIVLLLVFNVFVPNSIAESTGRGELLLDEKDLWGNVISEGANGILEYFLEGPTFVFDLYAEGLDSSKEYALIRSLEPETNIPYYYEIIKEATPDSNGNLVTSGSYDFGVDLISAEFLLVPVEMLNLLTNGPPSPSGRYLSGQGLIGYDDTDTELKCGCQASGTSFDQVGIPTEEMAVDFTLISTTGEQINLYDVLSEKPVMLIFGAYT